MVINTCEAEAFIKTKVRRGRVGDKESKISFSGGKCFKIDIYEINTYIPMMEKIVRRSLATTSRAYDV